jgi:hypothetical protein
LETISLQALVDAERSFEKLEEGLGRLGEFREGSLMGRKTPIHANSFRYEMTSGGLAKLLPREPVGQAPARALGWKCFTGGSTCNPFGGGDTIPCDSQ